MKRMKVIYEPNSAIGGYEYRVLGNDESVKIQQRRGGCVAWKTQGRFTRAAFDDYAEKARLYDPYDQNPAKIARLIEA